jgi:hypothetical protein
VSDWLHHDSFKAQLRGPDSRYHITAAAQLSTGRLW